MSQSSGGVATHTSFPVLHADNTILTDEVALVDGIGMTGPEAITHDVELSGARLHCSVCLLLSQQ